MSATYQVGDGNLAVADGLIVGPSAAAGVGFYGTTPVVQRATASSHTTITTTVAVSTLTTGSTSTWGFASSTQANQIVSAVAEIQATLVALGIWAA